MATFHELRLETISKHNTLIQALESKYMARIMVLLQQKAIIHSQMQQSLYEQLHTIEINSKHLNSPVRIKTQEVNKKRHIIKPSFDCNMNEPSTAPPATVAFPHLSPTQSQSQTFQFDPNQSFPPIPLIPQIISDGYAAQGGSYRPNTYNMETFPQYTSAQNLQGTVAPDTEVIVVSDTEISDETEEFACICGDTLREMKNVSTMQRCGAVFCDICNTQIKLNAGFYHCDREKEAEEHTHGFDICKHCAYRQSLERNMISNLSDTSIFSGKRARPVMPMHPHPEYPEAQRDGMAKWKCFYCNYSADSKRSLDTHILNHEGNERPWQCLYCGKSFLEKAHLMMHSKSHQQQKIFTCPRCNFVTHKKSELNMHARHHLGEKPVECSYCHKKYSSKITLKNHIRQHHVHDRSP
eukprot:175896_1